MISRRAFLSSFAALPLASRLSFANASPIFLSCADSRARDHYVVGFDLAGAVQFALKLPARGHGFATHPARSEAIVFARRPGSFAGLVDPRAGSLAGIIDPPRARCFYGHGTFSNDGALLYVCEHDDATGDGFVGVYDAMRGYKRIDEFSAGGIGPHEIRLMPNGTTLVVALGGIQTDASRDKLNIASMDPSLAYIDAASGCVVEQVRPPAHWHQLSIRHVDLDARGRVVLAMQYEGDAGEEVPLAALHVRGQCELQFLRAGEDDEMRLKHYLGDIAFAADGQTICATSPVGSVAALWDAKSGAYLGMSAAADGCGIVGLRDGFLISAGDGKLRRLAAEATESIAAAPWMWDNHMSISYV